MAAFPPLEAASVALGIGVASGRDRVYIAPFAELDVEPERKLPLTTARDLKGGRFVWGGKGIINPFEANGTLTNPEPYPKFAGVTGCLRSDVARLFVSTYSVEMRGGRLRFQAQNLRRICVPAWEEVSGGNSEMLIVISDSSDRAVLNAAVFELCRLDVKNVNLLSSLSA